ncbi:MAG: hypothetical protein GX951_00270 [Mollicutes bacterium]|nr:hypothetical protein [Mollicutes bacterium]
MLNDNVGLKKNGVKESLFSNSLTQKLFIYQLNNIIFDLQGQIKNYDFLASDIENVYVRLNQLIFMTLKNYFKSQIERLFKRENLGDEKAHQFFNLLCRVNFDINNRLRTLENKDECIYTNKEEYEYLIENIKKYNKTPYATDLLEEISKAYYKSKLEYNILKFELELSYIKNPRLKELALYLLEGLPDSFYEMSASSTGKNHPSFAQGRGGLVRHTKAAIAFLYNALSHPYNSIKFSSDEKDLMYISILIHDGFKYNIEKSKGTLFEHPVLAVNYIKSMQEKCDLKDEEVEIISNNVLAHMGPWNKDNQEKMEDLPLPKNEMEFLVHYADYFSSRKNLDVLYEEGSEAFARRLK